MALGGRKPRKGSLGTSFIIEKIPGLKRISCSNCINYESDKSCSAKGLMIMEIGYDYWNQCDKFELSANYDSEENQALVSRVRDRIESKYKIDKKDKKKGTIKSKKLTVKKVKKETLCKSKKIISRATVQSLKKQGISYQKIVDKFDVDKDLIRKIDLGFFGDGYVG